MKKMIKLSFIALLGVMVVSCSSATNEEKQECQVKCPKLEERCMPKPPCAKEFDKWAKFDSLSEEEQKELIKTTKENFDKREARIKAYKDSINALWNNFDNLTVEQQKSLLMKKMHGFHQPHFKKDGFNKGCCHKAHNFKKPHCKGPRPDGPRPEGACPFEKGDNK